MKPARALKQGLSPLVLVAWVTFIVTGCEAPLNLQGVEQEQTKAVHAFDHFKAVAASASHQVAAADAGVLLVAPKGEDGWRRVNLPTRAAFLNLASCPNGRFVGIDSRRTLWVSDAQASNWQAHPVDTPESLMALGCDRHNAVWLGASFSTVLRSTDFGDSWSSSTQDEDLQFTAAQFLSDGLAVFAGEFGTVMFSDDDGANWERAEPVPNDFYPMGLHFTDRDTGWVSGLSGTIWHTGDGGTSWTRQETETSVPLYAFVPVGNALFALGDNGTLLRLDADAWRRVELPVAVATYLIGGVSLADSDLLLAGGAGTLLKLDVSEPDARIARNGGAQ